MVPTEVTSLLLGVPKTFSLLVVDLLEKLMANSNIPGSF